MVGTVIVSVSIASIGSQVDDSTILAPEIKAEVTEALEEDVNTAGTEDLELALELLYLAAIDMIVNRASG